MKTLITPFLAFFLLVGFVSPKLRTIKGSVVSTMDGLALSGAAVISLPSKTKTSTDKKGQFKMTIPLTDSKFQISYLGFETKVISITKVEDYQIKLKEDMHTLREVVVAGYGQQNKSKFIGSIMSPQPVADMSALHGKVAGLSIKNNRGYPSTANTESYKGLVENTFHNASKTPLSTFSIDVDAASYSNVRRILNNGILPPKDAVRIEEMINYFDYAYEQPKGSDPVNIQTEIAPAPWNNKHRLVSIGLQAKTFSTAKLPASNLVFLIDVSGSMSDANKLPLLVSSLKLLTDQLRDKDKVAIAVYAGNAGLVLPATSGDNKTAIKEALNKLNAGGSTAGGQGIKLAYEVATRNFIKGGNNRVILATDGDFNVGASSDDDMEKLIDDKRKSGVFLTVLGFGMGNYKDSKMETLADKGNGNYAYIDNINEARKVLINEFGGTLFTVAKDVKLQIEFNPAKVQAYRLIGYENRLLNDEDFNDDKKDAGEMGSGHTVTALYEIIPVGTQSEFIKSVDPLRYQKVEKAKIVNSDEMLTVKLRYKEPDGEKSRLLQKAVIDGNTKSVSKNFNFSAAVAEFGMLLRQSEFKQQSSFDQLIALAQQSLGADKEGYRAEFLKMAKSTKLLAKDLTSFTERTGEK